MEKHMNIAVDTKVEFKKFPSLENTYRQKEIDMVENLGYSNEPYIVTEKVHGANFSFWLSEVDGEVNIRCAKRTSFIDEGEKFFNYKPVLEKYKENLIDLYQDLAVDTLVVYGELFGGNIQSGMCYKEDQDFVAFDVVGSNDGNYQVISKDVVFELLETYNIPTIPVIGIYPTLSESLEVQESFTSLLCREDFDGKEEHKESEGVVIEPVTPRWYPSGSRVYFKKKTKRFLEKGGKPNVTHKSLEELPVDLKSILTIAFEYITQPRFEAVCSKIGEVTIKDIGKVTGLMTQDILIDMQKDCLEIPDNKRFMKLLQQQVQTFIRPILLSK